MKGGTRLPLLAALLFSGVASGQQADSAPATRAPQARPLPPGHPPMPSAPKAASGTLPPGHPPTSAPSKATQALPPGHPPTGEASAGQAAPGLPPGHPPTSQDASDAENPQAEDDKNPHAANPHAGDAAGDAAAANPHAANPHSDMQAARDQAIADPSLPKGTIVASIVDPTGQPLSGVQVRLGKMFQSIAQGDQQESEHKSTDAKGTVTFSGLQTESNFSYRISVRNGKGEFASAPFQMSRDKGQRVLLHVYPVTSDLTQARVAMRGLVYVQPRDDVFQFEVWLQVYNVSQSAWIPENIVLELPGGSKAFSARDSMQDTRAEAFGDDRARISGTFPPGQHDVRFGFQVPNEQRESASFQLTLPPNVAEFRVIAEAAKGMNLSVQDFPPVQTSTGMQGERVLVSQKRGDNLDSVRFHISGLPTRGSAPWVAVFVAGFAAVSGLYSARNSREPRQKKRRLKGDLKQARRIILDELAALEAAQRRGDVGPKSYEQTRKALLSALARIIQPAPH